LRNQQRFSGCKAIQDEHRPEEVELLLQAENSCRKGVL